jgi:hypothetical protein
VTRVEALPEHLLRKIIKKRPGLYRTGSSLSSSAHNDVTPRSEFRHPDVLSGRSAPTTGRCRMKPPPPAAYGAGGCVEGAP